MLSLADIDDLVQRCRTNGARLLIREAIDCYRAGAYRSCVIAVWIALVYDIIDKLRDLALSGDAQAKLDVAEFDRIQASRDTEAALKFEREVLEIARDRYELISAQEHADLRRLFEDRNRFGHPNLNQDLEVLQCTPELARVHIRNAIEHVLERPPVQGKAALATLQKLAESLFFPIEADKAHEVLKESALVRAKANLVKQFYLGSVSSALIENLTGDVFRQRIAAAKACHRLHIAVIDQVAKEKLATIFDKLPDQRVGFFVAFLYHAPEYIRYVTAAQQVRLNSYISKVTDGELTILQLAPSVPFLAQEAEAKLRSLSLTQMKSMLVASSRVPTAPAVEQLLATFEGAKSFESANTAASLLNTKALSQLTESDALRIVRAGSNAEVKYSFGYPKLVRHLCTAGLITGAALQDIVAELDLGDVIEPEGPEKAEAE